jgi:hypothetical protein
MSLDYTKTGPQILVDQINADNPGAGLTTATVEFSDPWINNEADNATYNTAVILTPVLGQGFTGPVRYPYNRVDLASLVTDSNRSFDVGTAVKLSDMIDRINTALGVKLVSPVVADPSNGVVAAAGDYRDIVLPQPTAKRPSVDFVITADPASLVYTGSAILTLTTTAKDLGATLAVASTGLVQA